MRVFNELVCQEVFAFGAGLTQFAYKTNREFHELLGSVDFLCFGGYSTQVSGGGTPQLLVNIEHSLDQESWTARAAQNITLSVTGETVFHGYDQDPHYQPKLSLARLKVTFLATGPASAMVRIWVSGRDFSRRARRGNGAAAAGATAQAAPAGRALPPSMR